MRIPLLIALLVIACGATQSCAEPATRPAANYSVAGPTYEHGLETYVITSGYQEKPCKVWTLLPDKFNESQRYKVLYILQPDANDTVGIREAKKLDLANKYNIICVSPGFSRMPWYGDNPKNPKIRYDSYVPDVIVPFVDKTYPTNASAQGRVLVGFSKSGMGAVSLLLRYPDMFSRAGAWDTPLLEDSSRPDYYGSMDNFTKNYYLPTLVARQADMLRGQPARICVTGYGWGSAEKFHELLDQLQIPHYCDTTLTGKHAWISGWLGPTVSVLMSDDMARQKPVGKPAGPPRNKSPNPG